VTALFADCQVRLTPSAQSTFNAIVGVSIGIYSSFLYSSISIPSEQGKHASGLPICLM